MTQFVLFLSTAVIFLVIDVVMLTSVLRPLFERHLGDVLLEEIRLAPAVLFYLFYIFALQWLVTGQAVEDGPSWRVAINAALFGAVAYGTYEFTNYATLKPWSWEMVAVDFTWGIVLTTISAMGGLYVTRLFTS
ncbi:MAG: DUF2177 family protein [Pseudomonadota bacterium]